LGLAILAFYLFKKLSARPKSFTNLAVLITGGGSGLGRLMAHRFVEAGSRVVLWDINGTALQNVEKQLHAVGGDGRVWTYVCDVSDSKDVNRVAKDVKAAVGKIDILINNAGVVSGNWITELSDESIKRTFGVNALASFWTIRAFLPSMMQANSGHIVTIASAAGKVGASKLTDYCASKFAAVGMTEALRFELAHRNFTGIKVTCICPFYINTGMFEGVKTSIFLPMLDESYVVNQIIQAIKYNTVMLDLPLLVSFVPLLRMLPQWAYDFSTHFLKVNRAMDTFAGRSIESQKQATKTDEKKE